MSRVRTGRGSGRSSTQLDRGLGGWAAGLVVLCAALPYLSSAGFGFVWDDPIIIQKQLPALSSLSAIFWPDPHIDQISHLYYRPFIFLTFQVDLALGGGRPWPFHLSVVAWHALASWLVWRLGVRLFAPTAALAAACLFAVHPIHTEAVAWMAGRTDTIAATWALAALLFFVGGGPFRQLWAQVAASSVCMAAALLSKEVAVATLGVAGAAWLLGVAGGEASPAAAPEASPQALQETPRLSRGKRERKARSAEAQQGSTAAQTHAQEHSLDQSWLHLACWGAVAVVYFLIRSAVLPGKMRAAAGGEATALVERLWGAVAYYVSALVWPFPTDAFLSEIPTLSAGLPRLLLGSATVLLAAVVVWRVRRANLRWALLATALTISPSLAIALFSISETPLAERYLYLPSAFFCLAVGFAWQHLQEWSAARALGYRQAVQGVGLGLLGVLGLLTWRQAEVWRDDLTFWSYQVALSPNEGLPNLELGNALVAAGRDDEAKRAYEAAFQGSYDVEGRAKAANNLAGMAYRRQDLVTAREWCGKSLEIWPDYHSALMHLALLDLVEAQQSSDPAAKSRLLHSAETNLRKALVGSPYAGKAHSLLGTTLAQLGRPDEARAAYEQALRVLPVNSAEAREVRGYLKEIGDRR